VKKNISEREFIGFIQGMSGDSNCDVIKGIGDDCAVIRGHGEKSWLITTDTLVESIHFDLTWHPPKLLGRKAAAVNISDIAAMGGRPVSALLSVAVPDPGVSWLEDFIAGFLEMLQEHRVNLIGGDTVRSRAGAVFNVTVLGEADEADILYRSGAVVNDMVWVSGYLGEAAAGLELMRQRSSEGRDMEDEWLSLKKAHLDPEPRTRLGKLLAESGLVHAMMDLSDGLATDLAHISLSSGVRSELVAGDLPVSKELAAAAASLGMLPIDLVLKGGEDYQLLFTAPPANEVALRQLVAENGEGEIFCIGRITEGQGVHLLGPGGQRTEITYQGYDHFSAGRNQSP
jgi:thiamine-monophosphate kinase